MKKSIGYIENHALSQEDLLKFMALGMYENLKIFLSRNNNNHSIPQDFLWVNQNSFGKVTLRDINYTDNQIIMEVQDCSTGVVKDIPLDINNEDVKLLLISWKDIKDMVLNEILTTN